jgi:hypothetical protein
MEIEMAENSYDRLDIVRRENVLIADGDGFLKLAVYRVRDPETGEFGPKQFHATYNNMVMAVMGEEAAKLFAMFVTDALSSGEGS